MRTLEMRCLSVSFGFLSLAGCAFLVWYWTGQGAPDTALIRSSLFVGIMAVVHAVGLWLYQRQPQYGAICDPGPAKSIVSVEVSEHARRAVRFAVMQQAPLLLVSALMLDGGHLMRIVCVALIAHWCVIGTSLVRRPAQPTSADLLLIRFGFVPLALLIGFLEPYATTLIRGAN